MNQRYRQGRTNPIDEISNIDADIKDINDFILALKMKSTKKAVILAI